MPPPAFNPPLSANAGPVLLSFRVFALAQRAIASAQPAEYPGGLPRGAIAPEVALQVFGTDVARIWVTEGIAL